MITSKFKKNDIVTICVFEDDTGAAIYTTGIFIESDIYLELHKILARVDSIGEDIEQYVGTEQIVYHITPDEVIEELIGV